MPDVRSLWKMLIHLTQLAVSQAPDGASFLAQGEAKRALGERREFPKPRRGALVYVKAPLRGLAAWRREPRAPCGRPGLRKTPFRG